MAKQIKKFGPIVAVLALIGVFVIIPLAQSYQQGPPPMGDPSIGLFIRDVIGFGHADALPALMGDGLHRQMINHARIFTAEDQPALGVLMEHYRSAEKELRRCITWGEDTEEAYGQLQGARQAVAAVVGPLLQILIDGMPPGQNDLPPLVQLNIELDPEMRTLDLTIAQRRAVVAAQRERDRIVLNARFMYAQRRRTEAKEAFEQALQAVLTPDQLSVVQANRQLIQTRLLEMATAEVEPFQD